jgi:S-adenosylmethionine hydrolase
MRTTSPIILLTDFGTGDHYAGVMKGVLLGMAPGSAVVDLSHGVRPYGIDEAAFLLWSSYRWFPSGSIFVVVVDPGVGTGRRIVCLRTPRYTFLAPDNGVLKFVAGDVRKVRAYRVTASRLGARGVSATFHGRDIFAPAAARLARGLRPAELGPRIDVNGERMLTVGRSGTIGRVLHIDAFGNIITNILAPPAAGSWEVRLGRRRVRASARSYGSQPPGKPFFLTGSSGLLEISMNQRSAARALRARCGQKVVVCRA